MIQLRSIRLVFATLPSLAFSGTWAPRNLQVSLGASDSGSIHRIRLRTFIDDSSRPWMLVLDPENLETSVHLQDGWTVSDCLDADSTAWGKLRRSEFKYGWKNSGLSHLPTKESGIVLSVDLCPSHHPLDRRLIVRVLEAFRHDRKAVPVSFALSGNWIRTHANDLAWLVAMADSGKIDPTWINHTDHHYYRKGLAANLNFLFLPGTNVTREILGAESEMLRHGLVPSVFFRFPGLVDNESIFAKVLETGLLPVGADAWLAKNQKPGAGSIVLVHGNGNEPVGVDDFLRLLDRRRSDIQKGVWHLEDLSGELEEETDSVKPR